MKSTLSPIITEKRISSVTNRPSRYGRIKAVFPVKKMKSFHAPAPLKVGDRVRFVDSRGLHESGQGFVVEIFCDDVEIQTGLDSITAKKSDIEKF